MVKNRGKRNNFGIALATGLVLSAFLFPKIAYGSQKSRSPQKEKSKISLIVGARKGLGSNGPYGGGFGVRVKNIGLGLEGDWYSDRNLRDTEENIPGFEGISFQGREDLEKISYKGAFAEFYPRVSDKLSLVLGASGGIKKGIRNIEEKLMKNGTELASNTTSTPEKESAWRVYAGLIYDFTENISAGPFVGYGKSSKENGLGGEGASVGIKINLRVK